MASARLLQVGPKSSSERLPCRLPKVLIWALYPPKSWLIATCTQVSIGVDDGPTPITDAPTTART